MLIYFFNAVIIELIKISIGIKEEENESMCESVHTFAFEEILLCILVVLCCFFPFKGQNYRE